ncbi:AAA family ATPase [Actinomadura kijaniata]|uniref:helix-turn-helix transcriptional regulator n=1 Tax=Actinomadura kijaniata TaxID=46161 RepID=UPI003F1A30CF
MRDASTKYSVAFFGRRSESRYLTHVIGQAARGNGGCLVITGEAGIGKTALLTRAADAFERVRRVHAAGTRFESELPYAAVHLLCAPFLDHLPGLPRPSRQALEAAFGLRPGPAGRHDELASAVLALLTAADRPLLCTVDDAHWLDQASIEVLGHLARRLTHQPVALLLAMDGAPSTPALAGLPRLDLAALPAADARAVLDRHLPVPLDEEVRERLLAEAGGNPRTLRELAGDTGGTHLAGGFAVPGRPAADGAAWQDHLRVLPRLPEETRLLLLTAAAEPLGDPGLLDRARRSLGVAADAAEPALAAGVLTFDAHVRFRHPLLRPAIYRAAGPADRRAVHDALAQATDAEHAPDRRAWHLALAADRPDPRLARALLETVPRARARAGLPAAAAFLERAALLTADPPERAARILDAARAHLDAGAPVHARDLLGGLDDTRLDERGRARLDRLRARQAVLRQDGRTAAAFLLDAARRLADIDPRASRAHYLDALQAALTDPVGDHLPVVRAARAAPAAPPTRSQVDDLLDSCLSLLTREPGDPANAADADAVRSLLADTASDLWRRWPGLGCLLAAETWDFPAYLRIATRQVEDARHDGAPARLPAALAALASAAVHTGDTAAATALLAEAHTLADATGATPHPHARLYLAALRADRPGSAELIDRFRQDARHRDRPWSVALADLADAVLGNGLARYRQALDAARRADAQPWPALTAAVLPELVEAAVRCDQLALARQAADRLHRHARAVGTPWALGVDACAQAVISGGAAADRHYLRALRHLAEADAILPLARARLLYGEWLRRQGRRAEARDHLHLALQMLTTIEATGFAARAAQELRAAAPGRGAGTTTAGGHGGLTAQELRIAHLVRSGQTSREIADRLFLSPRTIDAHLRSIFRKLGITSRTQLRQVPLPPQTAPVPGHQPG